MATMGKLRSADLNMNIKVRELLQNFGFATTAFDVLDSYPTDQDLNKIPKLPSVVVSVNSLTGDDVELGSNQWPSVTFALDVFAKTDGQRDDISYYLWNNLNEGVFRFYDFSNGFPDLTTTIDYTGIANNSDYRVDGVTSVVMAPPEVPLWEGEKHHQLIFGTMKLPNN